MSSSRVPKYSRQRESSRVDRAYVRIDGRKIKLGVYGSPESKRKYAELISGKRPETTFAIGGTPTVNEILVAYLEYAQTYYRHPNGELAREYGHICEAAKFLRREAGHDLAEKFGPKRLKAIRQQLVDKGLSRGHINAQIRRMACVFRWAVEEELISETTHRALAAVRNLKRGRSKAKETAPVRPVDVATVEATLAELPEVLADMVRLQLLTGCRPGELCTMRPCDIDRSGEVWLYTPEHHKTEHRGHSRVIAIGPKAQSILLRYLARAADAYCFQPKDSESKRLAEREAARVTPKSCGNRRGTNCAGTFKAGSIYLVASYRQAIIRAAARAGVEHWTPHRLRHTKATEVRREFGLDAAQSVLGHKSAAITQVYAELDVSKASEVALQIG